MFESGDHTEDRPVGAPRCAAPASPRCDVGEPAARGAEAADPVEQAPQRLLGASLQRLSHELRTPLNGILGNAELLLDGSAGPLSALARACAGDVQTAGLRLARQVEGLLDLCRALAAPPISGGTRWDLIERFQEAIAAQTPGKRAPMLRVLPPAARVSVRGEPEWLDILAVAVADLHRDQRARDPLVLVIDESDPAWCGVMVTISWADFRPDQLASLQVALIDAILRLHAGHAALTVRDLRLLLPTSRLLSDGAAGPVGRGPAA